MRLGLELSAHAQALASQEQTCRRLEIEFEATKGQLSDSQEQLLDLSDRLASSKSNEVSGRA